MSRKHRDPTNTPPEGGAQDGQASDVHEERTPDLSIVTPQTHGGSYVDGRRVDPEPPAEPPEVTDV